MTDLSNRIGCLPGLRSWHVDDASGIGTRTSVSLSFPGARSAGPRPTARASLVPERAGTYGDARTGAPARREGRGTDLLKFGLEMPAEVSADAAVEYWHRRMHLSIRGRDSAGQSCVAALPVLVPAASRRAGSAIVGGKVLRYWSECCGGKSGASVAAAAELGLRLGPRTDLTEVRGRDAAPPPLQRSLPRASPAGSSILPPWRLECPR
jgi:hypothetical protein